MASIRRRFVSICVDQTLPRCNVHQTMSEWRGRRRSTSFDVRSTWIDARSITNRRFSRTRSLRTALIVDLHRFTSTSCSTLNQPISGLNWHKSTFGGDWDRLEATGASIWRRSASIGRRLVSIHVDWSWFRIY